jgi:hypothetical protein
MKKVILTLIFLFLVSSSADNTNINDPRFNPPQSSSMYPLNSLLDEASLFPLGGSLPLERVHHSINANSDFLILYGGYTSNGTILGDINLYHIPSQSWSNPVHRLECCNEIGDTIETIGFSGSPSVPHFREGFEGDFPLPRAEHASCVINEEMYIFGGVTSEYGLMNDVNRFNTKSLKWTLLDNLSGSAHPARRAGHNMLSDEPKKLCYVFGGRTSSVASSSGIIGLYDLWSFNALTSSWSRLDIPNINSVYRLLGRQYSASTLMNGNIYVFGGMDPASNLYYQDLWVFDMTTLSWTEIYRPLSDTFQSIHQFSPPPLSYSHLLPSLCTSENSDSTHRIYDDCHGLLIYGGLGTGGFCGTDVCGSLDQLALGQVYLYSLELESWKQPYFDENGEVITANTQSHWLYARLTSGNFISNNLATSRFDTINRNSEGKYIKTYGMEKLVFLPKRGLFYEFGGVTAVNNSVINDRQRHNIFSVESSNVPEKAATFHTVVPANLDVGGSLDSTYSDTQTGEHLRSQVDLPVNYFWRYQDAFEKHPAPIKYLRSLRKFSVASRDIVLIQEDNYV